MDSESVAGAGTVQYLYDSDGLIKSVGALSVMREQTTGLVSGATPGNITESQIHDQFGERTDYQAYFMNNQMWSIHCDFYNLGRIVSQTETSNNGVHVANCKYDIADRLWQVTIDGTVTATYLYDANGNRLSRTTGDGQESGQYDEQDRVVQYGKWQLSYSPNGTVSTKTDVTSGDVTTYVYDELGNLQTVGFPDGRTIEYVMDAQNRRIGKKIDGTLVKGWLYRDSMSPVAELDGSSRVITQFVYGTSASVPSYFVKNGVAYKVIADRVGTPREIVDVSSGVIVQALMVDEFGRTISDSARGFQPFGFAGGLYDPDTGLLRFGARDYDPDVGRWTAPDPIGFRGRQANLFVYVGNDPISTTVS